MRYGLIADIHGNLEAFEAVLEALAKERIDTYLCIGDVVGYGANPKECIKKVRSLEPKALVAGNHEWGALGSLGLDYFSELACQAIIWTKSVLSGDELEYLGSFKLLAADKKLTLVHGSLEEPKEFLYIFDSNDARGTFGLLKTQLCFVGHSHIPGIFYCDGKTPGTINGMKAKIEPGKKYIINIGSIGQPRDGDPRASFAVYDEDSSAVEIKRVAYDVEKAKTKILAAGLPKRLASRLAEGR